MRGEEVQLLGAVAGWMVPPDALLAQPGTHCKWATMTDGRIAGRCQPLRITQNFGGAGKTESNGFSRSGLGGNDQVAARSFRLQHCLLEIGNDSGRERVGPSV